MEQINRVAQATVFFWIMKICATTLGETAGDLFRWLWMSAMASVPF